MLISYGVNINEQKDGEQPLHVAAKNGKDKVVKILLENGGHVGKFIEACFKKILLQFDKNSSKIL